MTLDDKIHGLRLRVMQQAAQRGVSRVCQELGISRTLFYRWRRRLERYGTEGLHPRRWQAQPGRPRQLAPPLERLILSVAVSEATWGCGRLAAHLAHRWGVHVAPSTIQRLLRRQGWRIQRVLTDGGGEFHGAFDEACRVHGIRHTRTKPRHAWTNGFVERLQGTILQEHWRVEFRRRYFTTRAALARSLDDFVRFYNEHRPHQGYRLRGHPPATRFWGAAPVVR